MIGQLAVDLSRKDRDVARSSNGEVDRNKFYQHDRVGPELSFECLGISRINFPMVRACVSMRKGLEPLKIAYTHGHRIKGLYFCINTGHHHDGSTAVIPRTFIARIKTLIWVSIIIFERNLKGCPASSSGMHRSTGFIHW